MNLFNLLCIEKRQDNIELIFVGFAIISIIAFLYGIIQLCNNFRENDESHKKLFKRGLISFIVSLILIALVLFIMSTNTKSFVDPCNNSSQSLILIEALYNIIKKLIPLGFIIGAIVNSIRLFFEKDILNRKKLIRRIIKCFIIAILIFILITCIQVFMGNFVKIQKSSSYYTCWCK